MGLASNGGVHSSLDHLYALIEFAKNNGLEKVYLHIFTDGRDAPPQSGDKSNRRNRNADSQNIPAGNRLCSWEDISQWTETTTGIELKKPTIFSSLGQGKKEKSALEALQKSYDTNITDEFIEPTFIDDGTGKAITIREKDSVIFFNFREDRARQMTKAFVLPTFSKFKREKYLSDIGICLHDSI